MVKATKKGSTSRSKAGMKTTKFGGKGKAMSAKKGSKTSNMRKYNATRKAVFGLGTHSTKGY